MFEDTIKLPYFYLMFALRLLLVECYINELGRMEITMRRIILILSFGLLQAGCATSAQFMSELEEAPKWFIDQIPEVEAKGYPSVAATPKKPDDLPSLASWDKKMQKLKTEGEKTGLDAQSRLGVETQTTETFLQSSLQRADVEKFNEEEAAALADKKKD